MKSDKSIICFEWLPSQLNIFAIKQCTLKKIIHFLIISLLWAYNGFAQNRYSYEEEIAKWSDERIASLKSDNGWLNLIGLFWLKEGRNSFGSNKKNDIVFPEKSIPPFAGYIELKNQTVQLLAEMGVNFKINGQTISRAMIFSPNSVKNPGVAYGSLYLTIIKREDKIGIRLRDFNSPQIAAFKGIERFPVDTKWRFGAILKEPLFSTTVGIQNVLGQTVKMKLIGKVIFHFQEQVYSLDAVEDGNELLIVFGDATNSHSTYGSGRFISVPKPDETGKMILDFNKAYNPPCAFTPFATCPLPPPQNLLPFAVEAGEKYAGKH